MYFSRWRHKSIRSFNKLSFSFSSFGSSYSCYFLPFVNCYQWKLKIPKQFCNITSLVSCMLWYIVSCIVSWHLYRDMYRFLKKCIVAALVHSHHNSLKEKNASDFKTQLWTNKWNSLSLLSYQVNYSFSFGGGSKDILCQGSKPTESPGCSTYKQERSTASCGGYTAYSSHRYHFTKSSCSLKTFASCIITVMNLSFL